MLYKTLLCLFSVSLFLASSLSAQFDINFEFIDGTAAQQAAVQPILDESKLFWESNITGYQPGVRLSGVDIEVSLTLVTGSGAFGGHLLTGGSINQISGFSFFTNALQSRSVGVLALNPGLITNPAIQTASNHEIAHILGFGSLWEANGLYENGSGEYFGAAGLAAFQNEFDANATFVPIELQTFAGANFHLIESDALTDPMGRPIANALMTGFVEANPADTYFSETGRAIFVDLGYRLTKDFVVGDVNCDGSVNLLDVEPFVSLLTNGEFSEKADINQDGTLNLLDVQPFVRLLAGG